MGIFDRLIQKNVNKVLSPIVSSLQTKGLSFSGYATRTIDWLNWGNENKYLTNDSIYTIIRKRVQKEASIPIFCYKKKDAQSLKRYLIATKGQQNIQTYKKFEAFKKKAMDEIIVDNDFTKLLQKPNKYHGSDTFFQTLYTWYAYKGEVFIWKNRGASMDGSVRFTGKPTELHIIPPHCVELIIDREDIFTVIGYKITLGNKVMTIAPEDLIHWKSASIKTPDSQGAHLRGQSPLEPLNSRLQQEQSLTEQAVYGAQNGGADGAVSPKDLYPINQTQEDQILNVVNRNANNIKLKKAISFFPMPFEYTSFNRTNDEMQLLEQLGWTFERLCHAFGVPVVLFDSKTQYANQQYGQKNWVLNDVMTVVYSLRDELNRSLTPDFGGDIICDADFSMLPEMQDDIKDLVAAYLPLMREGVITPAELREVTNFEESGNPAHDEFYMNGVPIGDLKLPDEETTNAKWNDYEG